MECRTERATNPDYLGLHFTTTAYKLFYTALMDLIIKTWPDLDPATMPFILPAYNEIPFCF